jgi:2-dehydro-3-deoxyphosphogluconate aldolase/(4S)-4-hydroxy-2-oxoglutarate aldolase
MAQFTRLEVVHKMNETGMVPLFYTNDIETGKAILEACYEGGARVMEFTARGDFAHEVFAALVKYALAELPGLILGIGSVTTASETSSYMQMGANFIVTPVLREDIAIACNRRKVLWLPGCGSLTEIARAEELGCEIIKLFPGEIYGPKFVKSIKGPQPWTSIMPTGGVSATAESLSSWFEAGVTCVGMGSQLISKEVLEQQEYAKLTQEVKRILSIIRTIRK